MHDSITNISLPFRGFSSEAIEWLHGPNRFTELFDQMYSPQMPDAKEQRQALNRFYQPSAINRLRPDQVERIREDSRNPDNVTACYLYGCWLAWNATHLEQLDEVEYLVSTAAQGGYGQMWLLLRYMWLHGLNTDTRIDNERVAESERRAIESGDGTAYGLLTVKPLLYGWGVEADAEEATRLVMERIDNDGGEDETSDYLLTLLADCRLATGNNAEAERCARAAIGKGGLDASWSSLIWATCYDGDDLKEGCKGMERELYNASAEAGCSLGLYECGLRDKEMAEGKSGLQCKMHEHKARLELEKAALLGNGDACFELAIMANAGECGFTGESLDESYPFFLRGAMAGNSNCAYWMYKLQDNALRGSKEEREFTLPDDADHSSPDTWRKLAECLCRSNNQPWPEDN